MGAALWRATGRRCDRDTTARPARPTHPCEAFASWQWWNYACGHVPACKCVLRINMDETAVCLYQGGARGNIFIGMADAAVAQNVTRAQTRTYFTHVAFICDQPRLQPLMPQFLIGNEHTFPARQMAALRASCPPNVVLIRQKSSWNNAVLCARIVRRLGVILAPFMAEYQPVLLLDACRVHLAKRVFDAAAAARVWVVVIAAKMTGVIQPLDTHAFLRFKLYLQQAYQRARLTTADGAIGISQLIPCVCEAIRHVLQAHCWGVAFDHDGFGPSQAGVSERVRRRLEVHALPDIPAIRPSLEQLKTCFPKRAIVPVKSVWRPFDAPALAVRAHVLAPGHVVAPPAVWSAPLPPPPPRRSARLAPFAKAPEHSPPVAAVASPSPASSSGLARARAAGLASSSSVTAPPLGAAAPSVTVPLAGPMTRARARLASGTASSSSTTAPPAVSAPPR